MKRIFTFLTIMLLLSGMVKSWAEPIPIFSSETLCDNIVLQIENINSGSKFIINGEGKGAIKVETAGDLTSTEWTNIYSDSDRDGIAEFSLTDDLKTQLNNGCYLRITTSETDKTENGNYFKVKVIELEGNKSDNPDLKVTVVTGENPTPGPDEPGDKTTATVWTGAVATESWANGLTLTFSGADFKAGDVITIGLNGTSDGSQIQIGYEDASAEDGYAWAIYDGNKYLTIHAASEHKLTLDDAWATALNAGKALRVNGNHITVASVSITSAKTEGVTATEPKPVDPYEGWNKFTVEDDTPYAPTNWEMYSKVVKQDGMAEIQEGDVICIEFAPREGTLNFQYGFKCNEGETFGGYNVKDDETYGWGAYRYYGSDDYISGITSPYYITVDEALAAQLEAGEGFVIRGTNFSLDKITLMQPTDRRRFIWVDLLVPDASMAGKKNYGYGEDKDNDMEIADWMGTAKVVEFPAGSGKYAIKFFHEWWNEAELGTEADYDGNKKAHSEQLGEVNSLPVRLRRANTPNFALLKVGDMLRINVTCYTDVTEDGSTIESCAGKSSQAQLGTYDPEMTPGPDPEKPLQAFHPFTVDDVTGDYKEWGNTNEQKTIDFEIGAVMLKYITRYGLSINGRKFYLNSVTAKVYLDEDNETTETEHVIHDYFYNKTIPGEVFTQHDMTTNSSVYIFMTEGSEYTEHRVAKYKDKDMQQFIGY